MITRFTPLAEMKQLFFELLFNHTDRVTKITNQSALNGIAFGIAKVAQKANKEIALVESHLFPEDAFGQHLDQIAERRGIAGRFGASGSSTFIRIVAQPGTLYSATTHLFKGDGITFELTDDVLISSIGYAYAKVRSQSTGLRTNVAPLSINEVSPRPEGHIFLTNEYTASGGRDIEQDDLFRLRIKKGASLAARTTLDYLTIIFQKFNSNILGVYNYGVDAQARSILAISTQNGVDLTDEELNQLLENSGEYLSILNYDSITGSVINLVLKNVEYQYIDVSARVDLLLDQPIDLTRIEIQVELSKYADFRYWDYSKRIEWDDLLEIVKNHPMIKYVSDFNFSPNIDVEVPIGKLPRMRGFILMDLQGNLLIDTNQIINPIYYPSNPDFSFQQTILSTIS